jgi:hypothetical protein
MVSEPLPRCYPGPLSWRDLNLRRGDDVWRSPAGQAPLSVSVLARSGGDLYVTMNSESGRGDWIRTSDPLRPSATSCDYPRLSATTQASKSFIFG